MVAPSGGCVAFPATGMAVWLLRRPQLQPGLISYDHIPHDWLKQLVTGAFEWFCISLGSFETCMTAGVRSASASSCLIQQPTYQSISESLAAPGSPRIRNGLRVSLAACTRQLIRQNFDLGGGNGSDQL